MSDIYDPLRDQIQKALAFDTPENRAIVERVKKDGEVIVWHKEKLVRAFSKITPEFIASVAEHGHVTQPQSFGLAKDVCAAYEKSIGKRFGPRGRFDFRRAFELGFKFAVVQGLMNEQKPAAAQKWNGEG